MRDKVLLDIYVQFCLKYKLFLSKRTRKVEYTHPRSIFMLICWETGWWTQQEIADILHLKEHTNVIHGIKVAKERLDSPSWEWYKKEYDYWKIRVESKISAAVA